MQERSIDELREEVGAMGECVQRLMLIVANALPHTDQEVAELLGQWRGIVEDIRSEFSEPVSQTETENG